MVAFFLDAGAPTLAILQQFGEYSVCITQRSRCLDLFVRIVRLHQCVEALEQVETKEEHLIVWVSGQVEVERGNQGDQELTFARIISLIRLLLLTLALLKQVIDPGEDRLGIAEADFSLFALALRHFDVFVGGLLVGGRLGACLGVVLGLTEGETRVPDGFVVLVVL